MDSPISSSQSTTDIAEAILRADQGLDDVQRADLHDAYYTARDENELVGRLRDIHAPGDTQYLLTAAWKDSRPTPHPAQEALTAMSQLDPALLDLAEKHPQTVRSLLSVVKQQETKRGGPREQNN